MESNWSMKFWQLFDLSFVQIIFYRSKFNNEPSIHNEIHMHQLLSSFSIEWGRAGENVEYCIKVKRNIHARIYKIHE